MPELSEVASRPISKLNHSVSYRSIQANARMERFSVGSQPTRTLIEKIRENY
jgi:hypothetical protein